MILHFLLVINLFCSASDSAADTRMEGKQGRRELLEVIAQQKEQLARYETRLKDVVRAYKGLAKEKETLETSLKAITAAVNEDKEEEAERGRTDTEAGGVFC